MVRQIAELSMDISDNGAIKDEAPGQTDSSVMYMSDRLTSPTNIKEEDEDDNYTNEPSEHLITVIPDSLIIGTISVKPPPSSASPLQRSQVLSKHVNGTVNCDFTDNAYSQDDTSSQPLQLVSSVVNVPVKSDSMANENSQDPTTSQGSQVLSSGVNAQVESHSKAKDNSQDHTTSKGSQVVGLNSNYTVPSHSSTEDYSHGNSTSTVKRGRGRPRKMKTLIETITSDVHSTQPKSTPIDGSQESEQPVNTGHDYVDIGEKQFTEGVGVLQTGIDNLLKDFKKKFGVEANLNRSFPKNISNKYVGGMSQLDKLKECIKQRTKMEEVRKEKTRKNKLKREKFIAQLQQEDEDRIVKSELERQRQEAFNNDLDKTKDCSHSQTQTCNVSDDKISLSPRAGTSKGKKTKRIVSHTSTSTTKDTSDSTHDITENNELHSETSQQVQSAPSRLPTKTVIEQTPRDTSKQSDSNPVRRKRGRPKKATAQIEDKNKGNIQSSSPIPSPPPALTTKKKKQLYVSDPTKEQNTTAVRRTRGRPKNIQTSGGITKQKDQITPDTIKPSKTTPKNKTENKSASPKVLVNETMQSISSRGRSRKRHVALSSHETSPPTSTTSSVKRTRFTAQKDSHAATCTSAMEKPNSRSSPSCTTSSPDIIVKASTSGISRASLRSSSHAHEKEQTIHRTPTTCSSSKHQHPKDKQAGQMKLLPNLLPVVSLTRLDIRNIDNYEQQIRPQLQKKRNLRKYDLPSESQDYVEPFSAPTTSNQYKTARKIVRKYKTRGKPQKYIPKWKLPATSATMNYAFRYYRPVIDHTTRPRARPINLGRKNKKGRYPSGVKALREMRSEMKKTTPGLTKMGFKRFVRNICRDPASLGSSQPEQIRLQAKTYEALQVCLILYLHIYLYYLHSVFLYASSIIM